ncbi:MAG: YceI family protein [Bacteroidota bacterium]
MKAFLLFLSCLIACQFTTAQLSMDEFYQIDKAHSRVSFEVDYMGYAKVQGRFEDFSGTLRYQPDDLTTLSISFQLKTESIDTDIEWRDNDLRSANWFEAETYPTASFTSTSAEKVGEGVMVTGDLSIKDVTKTITIEMNPSSRVIEDIRGDMMAIFTGEFEIDRKEFHIMGKNWSLVKEGIAGVGDKVKVELSILGKQYHEGNLKNFVRNPQSPPGKIYQAYQEKGLESALEVFSSLKENPESKLNANAANLVGYLLIRQNKLADALQIFTAKQAAFPEEGNAMDSLAEAYARMGNMDKAVLYYGKSLEKDPGNMNAKEKLRHLSVK